MSKKFSAALKIVSEVTCAGTRETPSAEDCVLQFAGQNSDDCSVLQQFLKCFCWFQAGLLVNKSPTFTVFSIATSALI